MLKILVWNIWNYNQWEARLPYLAQCIKDVDADVVALQEVRYNYLEAPNQADDLLNYLQGYDAIVQPAAVGNRHWEGLAIFTKHPIKRVNYWGLSRDLADMRDAPHQRIVLAVELEYKGVDVCVFNSHWSLSAEARQRTAKEVVDFIEVFAKDKKHTLLMGDFNAEPHENAIEILKASHLQLHDTWAGLHESETGGTWEVPTLEKRIDYIFHGPLLRAVSCKQVGIRPNEDGVYPSDHAGLAAEFEIMD